MSRKTPAKPLKSGLSRPVNLPVPESNVAARRAVLRSLSGGALFAAISERLPGGWQRPIVSAAALPAHAQSSPLIGSETAQSPEAALSPAILSPSTTANPPLLSGVWRTNSAFRSVHIAPIPIPTTTGNLENSALIPQAAGAQSLADEAATTPDLPRVSFASDHLSPDAGVLEILFDVDREGLHKHTRIWIKVSGSAIPRLAKEENSQADYKFDRAVHVRNKIYIVQRLSRPSRITMLTDAVAEGRKNIIWKIIPPEDSSQITFSSTGTDKPYYPGSPHKLEIEKRAALTTTPKPTTAAPTTVAPTTVAPITAPSGPHVFITAWDVEAGGSVTIPAAGANPNYSVHWGDGAVDIGQTGPVSHRYEGDGFYEVKITGRLPRLDFGSSPAENRNQLYFIEQWGHIEWESMESAFEGCENLRIKAEDTPDLSRVTHMHKMFKNATNFTGDLSEWEVGNVRNMKAMFRNAALFDGKISDWDVSRVTNMKNMFTGVTLGHENYDLLLQNWSRLALQRDVTFHAGNSQYSADAAAARQKLEDLFGWNITDNGQIPAPTTAAPTMQAATTAQPTNTVTPTAAATTASPAAPAPVTEAATTAKPTTTEPTTAAPTTTVAPTTIAPTTTGLPRISFRVSELSAAEGDPAVSFDFDRGDLDWNTRVWIHAGGDAVGRLAGENTPADYTFNHAVRAPSPDGDIYVVEWAVLAPQITLETDALAEGPEKIIWTIIKPGNASEVTFARSGTDVDYSLGEISELTINIRDVYTTTPEPTTTIGLPRISFRVSELSAAEGDPAVSFDFDRGDLDWNTRVWIHAGGDAVGRLAGENTPADYTFNHAVRAPSPDGDIYVVEWAVLAPQITLETDALVEGPEKIIWTIIEPGNASEVTFARSGTDAEYSLGEISELTINIRDVYTATPEPTTTLEPTTAAPTTTATTTPAPTTVAPTTTNQWIDGAFVTTWQVTTGNRRITIPAHDFTSADGSAIQTRSYTVDWGDGSVSQNVTGQAAHNYTASGTYTVQITGRLPWIKFGTSNADRNKLRTIEQWGDIQWESMNNAFRGCANLRLHATDTPDLSRVTDMGAMFRDATVFTGNLSGWDVSRVTHMNGMFNGAAHFNGDISGWNVGNVVDMSHMFQSAGAFNQNISGWDVSNVTNMDRMFNMERVFPGPAAFNQNLGGWDVQSVAGATYDSDGTARGSMASMFGGFALSPENYDALLIGWSAQDVKSAVEFGGGDSFTTGTLEAEDARRTLASKGWEITDGQGTINWIDGAFITTWKVESNDLSITIPAYDFGSDIAEYTVDWGDNSVDQNTTGQAEHTYAAAGIYTVRIIGRLPWINFGLGISDSDKVLSIEQWGDIEWASMSSAFQGCENLQNNATDTPDLSRVTDMGNMFHGATYFKGDNLSDWDVTNIVDMAGMFRGVTSFNGDISSWNIQNVLHMTNMFTDMVLHTELYDALLIGWNGLPVQRGVTFDVGAAQYTTAAASARQRLRNAGWIIRDSGFRIPNAFVTIWQVDGSNQSITIPAYAAGSPSQSPNYAVDWGDGSVSENQTGQATHTYATPGTYVIQITGTLPNFAANTSSNFNQPQNQIRGIVQWGNIQWRSMLNAFRNCPNLKYYATDAPDLTQVTDMSSMFSGATAFNGDLNGWNVGNVTNMHSMFSGATSFNGNVSDWDVGSVTTMQYMFFGATSFDRDISRWNVENVANMYYMFQNVTLNTANYDAILIGWAALPSVRYRVHFHAGRSSKYSQAADAAHRKLRYTNSWRIYDGGKDLSYVPPTTTTES